MSGRRLGTVRRIDRLGRLVVPIELRRVLGIGEEGAPVEMVAGVDNESLVLRKYRGACVFCNAETSYEVLERPVCRGCAERLRTAELHSAVAAARDVNE